MHLMILKAPWNSAVFDCEIKLCDALRWQTSNINWSLPFRRNIMCIFPCMRIKYYTSTHKPHVHTSAHTQTNTYTHTEKENQMSVHTYRCKNTYSFHSCFWIHTNDLRFDSGGQQISVVFFDCSLYIQLNRLTHQSLPFQSTIVFVKGNSRTSCHDYQWCQV